MALLCPRNENAALPSPLRPALACAFGGGSSETLPSSSSPFGSAAGIGKAALIATLVLLATANLLGPAQAAVKNFTVTVEKKQLAVGSGMTYSAWTFDGTVPGPLLKVRQGDQINVQLNNHTTDAHGINIHAAQISPKHFGGESSNPVSYSFRAELPGVFMYHCNALPILDHIAAGMFGAVIVEPTGGWPGGPAQEIIIIQSEFYGLPDPRGLITPDHAKMVRADPDFVAFNGEVYKYDLDRPIQIKVGKPVRMFFVNAGPNLTSAVHIAGVLFSTVYLGGNPANALHGVDGFDVGPSEGAVFEFTVNEAGNYRFMDLQRAHQYKGAMAIIRAVP